MYNFLRAGAAAMPVFSADCQRNACEMIRLTLEAEGMGVRALLFPEMSITGKDCGSLFEQRALLNDAAAAAARVLRETGGTETLIVFSYPFRGGNGVYKRTVAAYKGAIVGGDSECYRFEDVPDARVLIAGSWGECVRGYGNIFLAQISEPEYAGARECREERLKVLSQFTSSAYVHVSGGNGETGMDAIYGGGCLICEDGRVLARRMPLTGGSAIVAADIDVELLSNKKSRECKESRAEITVPAGRNWAGPLLRSIPKNAFLPENKEEHPAFCAEILNIQAHALARRLEAAKAKCAVVNVSGGADSALALLAACRAMDILGRGRGDVLGLTLPGFGTTGRTKGNGVKLMEALNVAIKEISIEKACLQHFEDIGFDMDTKNVVYENTQARERTQIAMDIANMEGGFMVGTGDLSEAALGFSTFGGDHLSMYNPNAGITKTVLLETLRQAAYSRAFGDAAAEALLDIAATPVSPELLPPGDKGEIAQLTEEKIGPYELHDFFLYHMVRNRFTPEKIAYLASAAFADAYTPETVKRWLKVFTTRFFAQQFKRACSPESAAVLSPDVSLYPKGGFDIPSDASPAAWIL